MQDTSCLYSTVKNTSGGIKNFGFLPPHGRTLANNEEFTIFGDVRQALGGNRGNERSVQRRDTAAFEAAVAAGNLTILETPSLVIKDTVTNNSKTLQSANGVLSVVDPCWLNSI